MNMILFGKKVFAYVIKDLKIRSSLIRMDPELNDKCTFKRREWEKIPRREVHIKMEAEIGVMQLQAKERQGFWQPPETREEWNSFSLRASRRNKTCGHFDFGLLTYVTVTE